MAAMQAKELKKSVKIAHDKGNFKEEANLCNAIGNEYSLEGNYDEALSWHRKEQSLCEDLGNDLDTAIAYRRVGECMCGLKNFVQAIRYHKMHLEISQQKDYLIEEQRALGNLGRTYFIYSQSEIEARKEKEVVDNLVSLSVANYLSSLEVCRNLRTVSVSELAEMQSRLYRNLSQVYEYKSECDLLSARKYTEQALDIAKKVPLNTTVYLCHFGLGTLHYKDGHRFIALQCFHEALAVARKLSDRHREVDTLNKIETVYLELSQFEKCMTYLRDIMSIRGKDFQTEENKLNDVHHIWKLSLEVKKINAEKGIDDALMKARLLEELGDSCCELEAYPPALKFYGEQKCDTWYNIAKLRESAGQEDEEVVKAYDKAATFAEKAENPKSELNIINDVIKYLKAHKNPAESSWQRKLDDFLKLHPNLANGEDSNDSIDDDEDDNQRISRIFSTDDECKENYTPDTNQRMRSRDKIDNVSASPDLYASGNDDFIKRIKLDSSSDEAASYSEQRRKSLRLKQKSDPQPKKCRRKRKNPQPKKRHFSEKN